MLCQVLETQDENNFETMLAHHLRSGGFESNQLSASTREGTKRGLEKESDTETTALDSIIKVPNRSPKLVMFRDASF